MKRIISILILCSMLIPLFPVSIAEAKASNAPAAPVLKAKVTSAKDAVKLTISKTSGTDGYYIYAKLPGASKYKKIKTLKKDGTEARSYTYKNLEPGEYSFKVKAYKVVDGAKVTGAYSQVVKAVTESPEQITLIDFDGSFPFTKGSYPTKKAPYTISCKTDGSLSAAYLRLEYVDMSGNARPRDIDCGIVINSEKLSFYATEPANTDLQIMAYATDEDAEHQNNPIAASKILNVKVYDPAAEQQDGQPKDNDPDWTPPTEPKYADIVFENGYAYFGEYPQTKVTDATLKSKLNALGKGGSQSVLYEGKYYQYAEIRHTGNWYESKPVEWTVLEGSADSESVMLIANISLLFTGFTDMKGYNAGDGWDKSFLRGHLNGYALRSFDSLWSYDFMGVLFANQADRVLMEQSYGKTKEKVLLPTKAQVEKLTANKRIRKSSEMATIAGEYGYWLMDSAGGGKQYIVNMSGKITTAETWKQEYGVVPVIKVDLTHCNVIQK